MTESLQWYENGANIVLHGENYDLKVDGNRIIYVKTKKSSIFKSINHDMPYGLDRQQKKRFLVRLYQNMEARLKQEKESEEQDSEDIEKFI